MLSATNLSSENNLPTFQLNAPGSLRKCWLGGGEEADKQLT